MTRNTWIALLGAVVVFLGLYFGCNRLTPEQKKQVISQELKLSESGGARAQADLAVTGLAAEQKTAVANANQALDQAKDPAAKIQALEMLAGLWYKAKRADISGAYAAEIGNLKNTGEAWSIAGSTLLQSARDATTEADKRKQADAAVAAFDKAKAIEPDKWQHQLNAAICLAENPLPNEPMKGILSLLALDKQYPDQPTILLNLGRFGLQTGQFEKAIARLEKALKIDPNTPGAYCLLADAYKGANQTEKAADAAKKCSTAL